MSDLLSDPEARFDYLVEHHVIAERADGSLVTTDDFERVRGIYFDSYLDAPDDRFRAAVADVFDIPVDEAADRIEDLGVTREELATFLALQSHLDEPPSRDELAFLAAMAAEVDPGSPVPEGMTELTDDDYAGWIADRGDVAVFVWKRDCPPCESLKDELDEIRAGAPDHVAFAGVDGGSVSAFRREFEVESAPTTLLFAGGDLVESLSGSRSPDQLADAFDDAYTAGESVRG